MTMTPARRLVLEDFIRYRRTFVRIAKAAEILGVCQNTVRAWGAAGKITEYRHPANNYRLYKRKEQESLLAQLRRPVKVAK